MNRLRDVLMLRLLRRLWPLPDDANDVDAEQAAVSHRLNEAERYVRMLELQRDASRNG